MKYQFLKDELVRLIHSSEKTGSNNRFLSERQISEIYNVSRTTVRRAISELCKEGYLLQIHGSGTFLKRSDHAQALDSITNCTQNYIQMGFSPSVLILEKEIVPASQLVSEKLNVSVGSTVLFLKKLYLANRIVFNETSSYIPLSRFPEISSVDFSTISITEAIYHQYGIRPKRTENSIEAILPPADIAKNLKISTDTPIMLFEAVTSGISNGALIPLEYFKCYYRTDRFRFSFIQEHEAVL